MRLQIDWRSCHSMSEDHELEALERWCQERFSVLGRELRMIEVGSFHGKTTAIMAQFGRVLALDLWGNVEDGLKHPSLIGRENFIPFMTNMVRLDLIDRVVPVVATSGSLSFFGPLDIDVAFLDAGHYFSQLISDLEAVEHHMSKYGLIICHDYKRPGWGYPPYDRNATSDPWVGVAQAVDRFLDTRPWEVYEHYSGIIALRRE